LKTKYENYSLYNYCIDRWIWQHKFEQGKLNPEDKIKMLLERCGTFLLQGNFKNGMIIDDGRKGQEINKTEIPVSNMSSAIQDLFYSINSDELYTEQSDGNNIILDNEVILGNIDINKLTINDEEKKRKRKAYHNKIKKVYKQVDIIRPVLYKLKNIDAYNNDPEGLSEEEIKKWREKPFRNIHNENLFDIRKKVYKGHEGYIDKNKPYTWRWVAVDTDNIFRFDGNKYEIDKDLDQYHCDPDNNCEMDKVLCYSQLGNTYFFDMKINNINIFVHKL
jgi:hypothetical protein